MAKGGKSSPSGGGGGGGKSSPSGGGGGGGGGKSSPSPSPSRSPSPPAPTPGPKPPAAPTGGGGSAQSTPAQAVNFAKTFQSVSPSSSSSQQKEKTQERVQTLTEKAKGLIAGATASGIADPGKFKDILGKLKDLGKTGRVESLQTQKKTAVTAARDAANSANQPPPGNNPPPGGYTQEELNKLLEQMQAGYTEKIGGLETQLGTLSEQLSQRDEPEAVSTPYPTQQSSDSGTSEFDDWLKSFESQQDVGAFDPDLFRNLLGELESSKRRQKDWSERSARAAYGY